MKAMMKGPYASDQEKVVEENDESKEEDIDQEMEAEGFVMKNLREANDECDFEDNQNDEDIELDAKPKFAPLTGQDLKDRRREHAKLRMRRLAVPPHRYTPLRNHWMDLITPIVENLKLQIRMNQKRKCIEVMTTVETTIPNALQKAYDYIGAFLMGFDLRDAMSLLRMDDLFTESFEVHDVKRLNGDHLSRCIGRISGKDGKVKNAIENATRTRIVIADKKIHILGSFENIALARRAICSLILGSPAGKVYNHLRTVARRVAERL
eukprot:GDKJ01051996.1.p1 GENE.GDKJ01051996.1~~GDKJ01051996.1.p1  ORF type:complete len:266 (-),score=74.26 GDKJ01051996.1:130-927(-)